MKNSKNRPKNSTFKPLSTMFVPCMKIQGGGGRPPLSTLMCTANKIPINVITD